MLGLVVCLDKPRFTLVRLTLMTPPQSPPGIVSEYPSPQMRDGRRFALGVLESPVLLGWPRDKARICAHYAFGRRQLAALVHTKDAAVPSHISKPTLPFLSSLDDLGLVNAKMSV